MPVKIFIGNLGSGTSGEDLRPLFERYGQVTECDVIRNYGFVVSMVLKTGLSIRICGNIKCSFQTTYLCHWHLFNFGADFFECTDPFKLFSLP